jgi:glyoxylase-like metal-dependent hydrolase (beta-lactamase superfamily II)
MTSRVCYALLLTLSLQHTAVAAQADPFHIEFSEISDGIWLAQRPESTRQPVVGNGIIILNGDHVVVVDGAATPLVAERVIEGIRARTDKPVRYLVNTHWHGDHNLGNHRFVEAWPGIEIVAHRFTRQAMVGAPMNYVEDVSNSIEGNMDQMAALLESGALPDGSPIPAYGVEALTDLVQNRDIVIQEMTTQTVTAPTLVFEDTLTLAGGPRDISIRFLGNANTRGDAVVWLAGERLLLTGDIVVAPTPYGFGSYPGQWSAVIERMIAFQPVIIVPGHGPVMKNTLYLEKLIRLFDWLHAEVTGLIEAGNDLEAVRASLDFSTQSPPFTDGDPWLESRFRTWFSTPIVEAAWNEIKGIDNEPLEEPAESAGAN